jgi:hypothetical protein
MRISAIAIRRTASEARAGSKDRCARAPMAAKGAQMSVEVMAYVWKHRRELRGSKLIVALALADYSNDAGSNIFPSMQTLAFKARLKDVRSARRIVSKLERSGFLIREASGVGRGNVARWRINLSGAPGFTASEKQAGKSGFSAEKTGPSNAQNRTDNASKTGPNQPNPSSPTTYDPSLTHQESSAVDKSTSSRNGTRTRKCTHGNCPPHICLRSKEGYEAQDLENAGAVAARVMNKVAR